MLSIVVDCTAIDQPPFTLHLEHSLVSISKWESLYEKPFFGSDERSQAETMAYVMSMIQDESYPAALFDLLVPDDFEAISKYINSRQSGTWFNEHDDAPKSKEIITSELVYFWMVNFQIPFSPCEDWHFNRLMNLIRIAGLKQTKPKKMGKAAQAEQMRRLNAERRQQLGTQG